MTERLTGPSGESGLDFRLLDGPEAHSRADLAIVQFWDADEPPADVAAAMRGWAEANPQFRHEVFSERASLTKVVCRLPIGAWAIRATALRNALNA